MSLLTPLYILGLAGISLPIVLHLIRRTPQGRQTFSSLMFLGPSPPRLTRRSRLDHLLLLLLRALALSILAFAFARPFMRESASLALDSARGRRLAVLLDTSASMQRADVWAAARKQVEDVLQDLDSADDISLLTFDTQVRTVVDFDDGSRPRRQAKAAVIREQLNALTPTWAATNLALALSTAADSLTVSEDRAQSDATLQIVLISDMQRSARVDSLESYEWPAEVTLNVRPVHATDQDNATLRLLSDEASLASGEDVRVRVTNSTAANSDQFFLQWAGVGDARQGEEVALYVPAGQSRVIRLPLPSETQRVDRIVLRGDRHPFDNQFFTVPVEQQQVDVVYIGSDSADDADGAFFYLQIALEETPQCKVNLQAKSSNQPLALAGDAVPQLVVACEAVAEEQFEELKQYVRQGGALFVIAAEQQSAVQLVSLDQNLRLLDEEPPSRESDYVMLSDIDFTHPLFAAFDDPQYSDFTKIHFWSHTRFAIVESPATNVVARFDDGSPALWELKLGQGQVFVLASSWRPESSQLALSSKFVPLVLGILEQASGGVPPLPSYLVNQPVAFPERARPDVVEKPDGTQIDITEQMQYFGNADQPGVYRVHSSQHQAAFAVNISPHESETELLDYDRLAQFGIPLGDQPTYEEQLERQRQLRDIELEDQQKLWQWMIALALCVLTLETWLAGRTARKTEQES